MKGELKCGTCGEPAALQVEDETTATLHCASGHRRYFYRREDGAWESQEERKRRLSLYRVCEQCGAEYLLSYLRNPYWSQRFPGICPACITPLIKAAYRLRTSGKRNNSKSPWRIPTKGYQATT